MAKYNYKYKYQKYKKKYLRIRNKRFGCSDTWYFGTTRYDQESINKINQALKDIKDGTLNLMLDEKNRLDLLYSIPNGAIVHIIDFQKMEVLDMSTLYTYKLSIK